MAHLVILAAGGRSGGIWPPYCHCERSAAISNSFTAPGIDEPIYMIGGNGGETKYYYHFDGLNSVVTLSDETSDIVELYPYDVFVESNHISNVKSS